MTVHGCFSFGYYVLLSIGRVLSIGQRGAWPEVGAIVDHLLMPGKNCSQVAQVKDDDVIDSSARVFKYF